MSKLLDYLNFTELRMENVQNQKSKKVLSSITRVPAMIAPCGSSSTSGAGPETIPTAGVWSAFHCNFHHPSLCKFHAISIDNGHPTSYSHSFRSWLLHSRCINWSSMNFWCVSLGAAFHCCTQHRSADRCRIWVWTFLHVRKIFQRKASAATKTHLNHCCY